MQKLVLIDGNAIIHRAFHALPPLSKKGGQLTNAVYGFFSMFLKILEDLKPDCVIVCFDRPKPTFRQKLYKEYQAHRPKMDEGLVPQFQIVHEVLERAKVKIFEMDGYEADDLIGTIAKQSAKVQSSKFKVQSLETIIVSGDRDLLQLVNSHVRLLAPITGITKMILYDEVEVEKKYGIKPKQIIDYKALIGDASDNYPGVLGVGPKTAVNLLKNYQTLEEIYQNVNQIKKKNEALSQKLKDGKDQAELAKKLATIVIDAPVTLNLDECSGDFDRVEMKKAFEELGFKSLIKRLVNTENTEKSTEIQKGKVYRNSVDNSVSSVNARKKKGGEQLGLL